MRRSRIVLRSLVSHWAPCVVAAGLALSTAGHDAHAQSRLSEKGVVAQTVGNTTITVEYYRPVARGRASIFPNVVHWDELWTPGANWATTVDVDHDVKVEGRLLPKGRYSLWTRVRPDSWTVDFHRNARRFHFNRPDSTDRQLRVSVHADSGAHTEVLTFDFPEIATGRTTRSAGATSRIRGSRCASSSSPRRPVRTTSSRARSVPPTASGGPSRASSRHSRS